MYFERIKRDQPFISIVLPAHNEEKNVPVIYEALITVLKPLRVQLEILFVDDGSKDHTARAVNQLQQNDPAVRLIRLTRNFGHQAALVAGMNAARGDAIITMDSDMQHPPTCLPKMIESWQEGYVVVRMARMATEEIRWHKKLWSHLFYKFINLMSLSPIPHGVADFQLLDKIVVKEVIRLKDTKPFLRGMIGWFGFKSTTLNYTASKRHAGVASYTFKKSLALGGRALILVSRYPLRLGLYLGLFTATICIAYIIFAMVAFLMDATLPGWTSLIISSLFIGSSQLIVLGILGEYIGCLFDQSRNLPIFVAYPEEIAPLKKPKPEVEVHEPVHHL